MAKTPTIKQAREELGLSMAEMAERVGYGHASSWLRLERGEFWPRRPMFTAIAQAFGWTDGYLMMVLDRTAKADK
jgi:transcriptional regulator with XRE-family HTH domain